MKVYILRGVSGSGKSTEAMRLASNNKDIICSADDYFMKNGEYKFDPSKLGEAHGECLAKFRALVKAGAETIIVDNTNTQWWEIRPYYETFFGPQKVTFEFVEFAPPSIADEANKFAALCAARNKHGVSVEIVKKQIARWEPLPDIRLELEEVKIS